MQKKIVELLIVIAHLSEQMAIMSEELNKAFDILADKEFQHFIVEETEDE
jgi:hypothetical protein